MACLPLLHVRCQVLNRDWRKARMRSDALLAYITNASATATLEDIRRDKPYDAEVCWRRRCWWCCCMPRCCRRIAAAAPLVLLRARLAKQHHSITAPRRIHAAVPVCRARLAQDRVSRYLNLPEVRANIAAPPVTYSACSKAVDAVMGHDVMKSVAHLVPDLLARSHVLLYQGQASSSSSRSILRLALPAS